MTLHRTRLDDDAVANALSFKGQTQTVRLHFYWITVGTSWCRSWPEIQPSPHRKPFKARLPSQTRLWLQRARTSRGGRHSGSPLPGINPRTNEQVWQDWMREEKADKSEGQNRFSVCGYHLQWVDDLYQCRPFTHAAITAGGVNRCHYLQVNVEDTDKHDWCVYVVARQSDGDDRRPLSWTSAQ